MIKRLTVFLIALALVLSPLAQPIYANYAPPIPGASWIQERLSSQASTDLLVFESTYVGNGIDDTTISGVGFQPQLLLVKGENSANAIMKTDTMGAGVKQLPEATQLVMNRVKSLDADGFTLGTDIDANANGTTYRYIAVADNSGGNVFATGTYVGDLVDDRNITDPGLDPDYVAVMSDTTTRAVQRSSDFIGDASVTWIGADETNNIQGFITGGFQVGTNSSVNASGVTYHWLAMQEVSGVFSVLQYTGDGVDGRNITGLGFDPVWVQVKIRTTSFDAAWRFTSNSAGQSNLIDTVEGANRIQAFITDGFQVGTDTSVNTSPRVYFAIAFAEQSSPGVTAQIIIMDSIFSLN